MLAQLLVPPKVFPLAAQQTPSLSSRLLTYLIPRRSPFTLFWIVVSFVTYDRLKREALVYGTSRDLTAAYVPAGESASKIGPQPPPHRTSRSTARQPACPTTRSYRQSIRHPSIHPLVHPSVVPSVRDSPIKRRSVLRNNQAKR